MKREFQSTLLFVSDQRALYLQIKNSKAENPQYRSI
jgi:hypothetical protein